MLRFFAIAAVLVIGLIAFGQFRESRRLEKYRKLSVGKYELLEKESTIYAPKGSEKDAGSLYLLLNDDMSFSFSRSAPFIIGVAGHWEIKGGGLSIFNELKFNNTTISTQASRCCHDGKIEIKHPKPKVAGHYAEKLVFKKL